MRITYRDLAVACIVVVTAGAGVAAQAGGPRQTILDWHQARTVEAADAYLPAATRERIRTFRTSAGADPAIVQVLNLAVAPGAGAAAVRGSVTAKGQELTFKGQRTGKLTLQGESIDGDRATVAVALKFDDTTAKTGKIELTRDGGSWRIAAVDVGDGVRLPRFDSATFVEEAVATIAKALEQDPLSWRAQSTKYALQSLMDAQVGWRDTHAGFYAPEACFKRFSRCGPEAKALESIFSRLSMPGYSGAFHAGDLAPFLPGAAPGMPRSLRSWAYVMTPLPGVAGPTYCGDSTGGICTMTTTAATPRPSNGRCPAVCK